MIAAKIDWKFSRKHFMVMGWWTASSPVRDRFGIILDGAVRSGKSLPGSCSYLLWAFSRFPQGGKDFFFAGKTIGSVRRNIVKPLIEAAPYLGFAIQERRQDSMLVVTDAGMRTHNFYLFGGNDERSQDLIQGFTGAGGFFDEAPLMPKSFVEQALARLSVDGATAWFTSNPSNPNHWFKREYIDRAKEKNLIYLHMTMSDNLSLSKDVLKRYESMFSGVFYRRYIKGEWCVAEGLVYPEFVAREDAVFDFNGDYKPYGELVVSCDYGTQNAMVYLLHGWHAGKRRWEVIKEWYHSGRESENQMTDAEYYQHLVEFVGKLPVRDFVIDPSAASFIALVRKAKKFRVVPANNSVSDGIGYTASLIHISRLAIARSCEMTIREMGQYSWDPKKVERGEDAPIKENDHCPDAVRYFAYTHIRRYEKRYGILISREAA
ncbi:MAG: PBSX family phage terminase large subunit [Sphaerochaeta sp.]|nr:PBSX family phage terminase large subunit [Sphaerochaeta sp.]